MGLLRWALAVLVALVLGVAAAGAWAWSQLAPVGAGEAQVYLLRSGTPFGQVIADLKARDLIRNPDTIKLYAKLRGWQTRLQFGYYRLSPEMSADIILERLVSGKTEKIPYTIPEGYRIDRASAQLEKYSLSRQVYETLASSPDEQLRQDFPFIAQLPSLEGYLFPDTYYLSGSERELIYAQLRRFQELVLPLWQNRPANHPLSLNDTLKLASVVELEGLLDRELPIIAGVFLERMRIGMKLESDPTVEYAMKRHQGNKNLTLKDIAIDSPYNSYRYPGLPPTPIGSPGLAAIKAVLYPQKTPYLFFVAKGDGSHAFSRTYPEHLNAIRRIYGRN